MTFHEYLSKAIQDDAQRAGERDRLILKAQRAQRARRQRAGPATPVRLLTRLLFRRAAVQIMEPPSAGQTTGREGDLVTAGTDLNGSAKPAHRSRAPGHERPVVVAGDEDAPIGARCKAQPRNPRH
jgi:hypothetical protein